MTLLRDDPLRSTGAIAMEKLPERATYTREQVPHTEERNVVEEQARDVSPFALSDSFGGFDMGFYQA